MLEKILVLGIFLAALGFILRRWRASWKAAQRGASPCTGCGGCAPDDTTCSSPQTRKDLRHD
ncbi:MAG: FeoB-associated Cys-rich membrane protein [Thermodesulfobacteriota bacterium]